MRKNLGSLTNRTEKIIQGITGSKEEGSGNIFMFGLTKRR